VVSKRRFPAWTMLAAGSASGAAAPTTATAVYVTGVPSCSCARYLTSYAPGRNERPSARFKYL